MTPSQYVDAWTRILFRGAIAIVALFFLWIIRDILVLFVVAIIITASIAPAVERLESFRIPRTLAVLGMYAIVVTFLVTVVSLIVPVLSGQVREFSSNAASYFEKASLFVSGIESYFRTHDVSVGTSSFASPAESSSAVSGLFSTTVGIVRGVFSTVVVFFLSLYMSLERRGIDKVLRTVTPVLYEERVLYFSRRIQDKIGQWMFGQLLLMTIVFSFYFIGLTALGIPYALILALLGGLLEMVPYAGPTVAAIPAILLGFAQAPWIGLAVIVLYIGIQQVQNHVIIPQVMRKAVGLNPVAVILAVLIGAKLAGIAGILLAVPSAAALSVFTEEFLGNKKGMEGLE
ncbi:MAG: AI-2E family transporter [Candidatus Moraniibacteriota bacterium]|nr:MAG: AI-2E family transporter [Candidatus Moranbacteria bacterium]